MYLVFAGQNYYPNGGFEDFAGRFLSLEDARSFVNSEEQRLLCDWWQIVEVIGDSLELVESGTT